MESSREMAGRALPSVEWADSGETTLPVWEEFSKTYEQCLPLVLRYTLARVHDPQAAEDLTGDIFERALRNWPTYRRRAAISTWIIGIARHVIADHWRRPTRQPMSLDVIAVRKLAGAGPTPEDEVQQREDEARLRAAIERLSEHEQDLLALRYAADMSLRELASLTGTKEGTVRVQLHRARERLHALLAQEMFS